jgi:outer membrane protein
MRFAVCALLAIGSAVSSPAHAQSRDTATGPVLTLDDAIALARRNNPTHLQTMTSRDRAGAQVRSAYGALLPTVNTSFGSSYRQGGTQFVNGVPQGAASDVLTSGAGISLNLNLSGSSLMLPKQSRADLDAADANVTSSEATLRTNVVTQYLSALQAKARAQLQDTLLANVQAQLDLAKARAAVGAATTLDVRRAEVQVGQQQVAVLREQNNVAIEKLRLFQQMGVQQPDNVRLTTEFPMTEPTLKLEDLLQAARRQNPALLALEASERSADVGVRRARSAYVPSLNLNTGYNGQAQQQVDISKSIAAGQASTLQSQAGCFSEDSLRRGANLPSILGQCNNIVWTPAREQSLRDANRGFPFGLKNNPLLFQAQLSLPIFDGFNREQQIENATATRNDARYRARDQELRLTADVTAANLNLVTAYRTVKLQEQNSQTAREALSLAQERFRVGANSFVDVVQARADYERAETDRINAIYDFHKAFATLESAVGRPLR